MSSPDDDAKVALFVLVLLLLLFGVGVLSWLRGLPPWRPLPPKSLSAPASSTAADSSAVPGAEHANAVPQGDTEVIHSGRLRASAAVSPLPWHQQLRPEGRSLREGGHRPLTLDVSVE